MGEGILNDALSRLVRDLESREIEYRVIGAVALNAFGYHRFTEDIDVLLSREGLERFRAELVGLGYRPAFEGATRKFRTTEDNVPVEFVVAGEFPGDGKEKPVSFPEPSGAVFEADGFKTLPLEKLVELKLASGITAPHRLKDLADVQELIKARGLTEEFADRLDRYVRPKFLELQRAVSEAED